MRRVLLGTVAVFGLGAALSQAADLSRRPVVKAPPPPVVEQYDWSGFYIGIVGGGGFGSSEHAFPGNTHGRFDIDGGVFGGTLGVNWQSGPYVWGIEGDGMWSSIDGSTTGNPFGCVGGFCRTENHWLATAARGVD
jgi:outer membrane immunogenic protein